MKIMKMNKFIKELIPYIIVIIIVILIRTFIVTPVIVNGDSMKPTLNENEILLLNKYDKEYKRFDIVVLDKSVEGDNRSISLDSRILGKINKTQIEGKVNFTLFPFNKFGKIK